MLMLCMCVKKERTGKTTNRNVGLNDANAQRIGGGRVCLQVHTVVRNLKNMVGLQRRTKQDT